MLQTLPTFAMLATFWGLAIASRALLPRKSRQDWWLDGLGLVMQGLVIPLLQVTAIAALYAQLFPQWAHRLQMPGPVAFGLSFAVVDYLYYWNHRALHRLWPLHAVHHSIGQMDMLGTSRNSLLSSFCILYLWVNGLGLYLLQDPVPYAWGATLTAMLDLWRHSSLQPTGAVARWLEFVLILPQDHAWHHASLERGESFGNYGANWKLWDRLHGTLIQQSGAPAQLGIALQGKLKQSWVRQLLWPFG
jgi:sterol desaturase/sphingolipid hydroxylase (fatty acid hydroxylase superfamily)